MRRNKPTTIATTQALRYEDCLAKSYLPDDGRILPGRSVFDHCRIVGEVAKALIARYPERIRHALFPVNAHLAAAGHDIGKVSPTFAEKIRCACGIAPNSHPGLANVDPELEKAWGGHAGVSQLTAVAIGAPCFVPEILGQHHGYSPPVAGMRARDTAFGGEAWQIERERLVDALKTALHADWPQIESEAQARVLAGLTSVADWIGSGAFFEDPQSEWRGRIDQALNSAGFIPPRVLSGLSFEQIYGFAPRLVQQVLIEQARTPGVYVLEAPMGIGKTEAALYIAYRMLSQGFATGIYFALPTQLTSNKIYERFNAFLTSVLHPECGHRALLLHGTAWLLETTEMGEDARPGGAWFNQAKRGLLAPFAVGTIDQALMAVMNVKHGFVRAFGLAGKVIILDEIHTYDAYTGTLLDALVSFLRQIQCTVIILSATLHRDRRRHILDCKISNDDYPLITSCPTGGPVAESSVALPAGQRVTLRFTERDELAIAEALDRARAGQQVLWIENTVADAQERYLELAARGHDLGIDCGLLHSRFTQADRQKQEERWVSLFGKKGWKLRPRQGRILIGTQVLEQSLDIDADFMVSRFCPTDMLLQRLGRLWRHPGTPRPAGATCAAWLLAPPLGEAVFQPLKAFGATAAVYSPYVLCRSLEVWAARRDLQLPRDIRPLIEATYCARQETGELARWLHELQNGSRRRTGQLAMQQMAHVALAINGATLPESKAETRYSDSDSSEVLLLRDIEPIPTLKASRLTLLSGEQLQLPWARHRLDKRQWRQLSAQLMRQIVKVRFEDAPCAQPVDSLQQMGLHHCFYLGNPEEGEALLRVALVEADAHLRALHGGPVHERHHLAYRGDLGYRIIKTKGKQDA